MRLVRMLATLSLGWAVGCGASYQYAPRETAAAPASYESSYDESDSRTEMISEVYAVAAPSATSGQDYDFADDEAGGDIIGRLAGESAPPRPPAAPPPRDERIAQANPPAPEGEPEMSDAVPAPTGPLLIYTAELTLGVFEVADTQARILAGIQELQGFLSRRSDTLLVLRVPAAKFRDALALIEEAGDVLARNVEALDVSEEFRDLQIRIRNAEAMRDRLELLLTRADDVESALAIERELQRLTEYIETVKGRQRFLADRISLSTITVAFRSLSTEPAGGPDGFVLPFPWLDELGLSNLMRLR